MSSLSLLHITTWREKKKREREKKKKDKTTAHTHMKMIIEAAFNTSISTTIKTTTTPEKE